MNDASLETSPYSSADDLAKDVFAHFGSAYYFSECVHRQLANMYSYSGFRSAADATRPRLEEKLRHAFSLTLGQLADPASQFVPQALLPRISEAVVHRNFLAHHFWYERITAMSSEDGMRALIDELSTMAMSFKQLDEELVAAFEPTLRRMGISPEMEQTLLLEALRGIPSEPLPNKRLPRKHERLVRAWNVPSRPGKTTVVFESVDGTLWQLCEVGLGWTYLERDTTWTVCAQIQKHLPATVEARPPARPPWNYEIMLQDGVALWVASETPGKIRWGLRSQSKQPSSTETPRGEMIQAGTVESQELVE